MSFCYFDNYFLSEINNIPIQTALNSVFDFISNNRIKYSW